MNTIIEIGITIQNNLVTFETEKNLNAFTSHLSKLHKMKTKIITYDSIVIKTMK